MYQLDQVQSLDRSTVSSIGYVNLMDLGIDFQYIRDDDEIYRVESVSFEWLYDANDDKDTWRNRPATWTLHVRKQLKNGSWHKNVSKVYHYWVDQNPVLLCEINRLANRMDPRPCLKCEIDA